MWSVHLKIITLQSYLLDLRWFFFFFFANDWVVKILTNKQLFSNKTGNTQHRLADSEKASPLISQRQQKTSCDISESSKPGYRQQDSGIVSMIIRKEVQSLNILCFGLYHGVVKVKDLHSIELSIMIYAYMGTVGHRVVSNSPFWNLQEMDIFMCYRGGEQICLCSVLCFFSLPTRLQDNRYRFYISL